MPAINNEIYHLYRQGNRKIKDGDAKAYKGTLLNRELPVSGTRLQFLMIEAAPAYGFSANAIALLNALFSFLDNDIDFKMGHRAILWASNEKIMIRAGFKDKKTLNRARDQLRAAGLIYYKDSPNKTRSGMRDKKSGAVVTEKTFGIDLTPIRNYYAEIIERIKAYRVETAYKAHIKKTYRSVKRRIMELFPFAGTSMKSAEFNQHVERFDALKAEYKASDRNFKLKEVIIEKLEKLAYKLHEAIQTAEAKKDDKESEARQQRTKEMSSYLSQNHPKGGQNAPDNIPITKTTPSYGNGLSDRKVVERAGDKRALSSIEKQWATIKRLSEASEPEAGHKMCNKPPLNLLTSALPKYMRNKLRDDHGFYEVYDILEPQLERLGLDSKLVSHGRAKMGLDITCGAIAVMLDKGTTVNFPNAYFSSMIDLCERGKLNIPASLFGIIERRKQKIAERQMNLEIA